MRAAHLLSLRLYLEAECQAVDPVIVLQVIKRFVDHARHV